MRYLVNPSTDPHFNMAFDQYCLEKLEGDHPVFYLWQNRPSVIIGLNQSAFAEVNLKYLEDNGITLARRVTGGGAVYHDLGNLNYSVTGRAADLDADCPGYLHLVCDALKEMGVDAGLSGRNDIMVDGKKCSGYAKRVWKDRLMVHGTLMFDVDFGNLVNALAAPGSKVTAKGIASVRSRVTNLKDYLPEYRTIEEFKAALHEKLCGPDGEAALPQGAIEEINSLADNKFRTWEWNIGKSPSSAFHTSGKFSCGTVEVSFDIRNGLLSGIHFEGDFLGNRPAEEIAARLEGCRFAADDILSVLSGSGQKEEAVENYFDGLSSNELKDLLLGL